MKVIIVLLTVFGMSIGAWAQSSTFPDRNMVMDLTGEWNVFFDSKEHLIILPGSLAENKLGIAVRDSAMGRLSEEFHYEGTAVFTRYVDIPDSWDKKPLELFMERTKCSTLYINDSLVGSQSTVSAPHRYILKNGISKGTHLLKLVVDNTKSLLPLGGSHAYSEHTQTNWNGILGRFYLRCLNDIDVRSMRIDTSPHGDCILTVNLLNNTFQAKKELFKLTVCDSLGNICTHKEYLIDIDKNVETISLNFKIDDPRLWDEYNPYLYNILLESEAGISQKLSFGIRDFRSVNGKLMNNDRIVFLRGKHEGGVFPLTGYPSMKKGDWLKYFSIVQSYGINHVRYHSWTPPAVAFDAADELGVTYKAQGPNSESDIADQVNMINTAIAAKPAGLGLAACDTSSVLDALQECVDKGIPVVTFDTGIADAPEGSVVCEVCTDNAQAGSVAAENMYNAIKDVVANADGQVIIGEVNQDATALNIQERGLGFIDEMIKLCTADGKKVAVVGNEFYVNNCSDKGDEKTAEVIIEVGVPAQTTVDLAATEANKIMSKADTIAIFGSNQTTAEGVITANETLNKLATDPAEGIIGAGFDAGTPQKAAINNGKLIGSVTQSPLMMGYKTIYTLVDVCNGKPVEDIPMDGYWYNADNMEDEDIAPNLYD